MYLRNPSHLTKWLPRLQVQNRGNRTPQKGIMSLHFLKKFKKSLIYPLNRRRLCWRDGDHSRCWRAAASSPRPTASLIRTSRTTPRCLPVILTYNKKIVRLWYSCCGKHHIRCSKYFTWQSFLMFQYVTHKVSQSLILTLIQNPIEIHKLSRSPSHYISKTVLQTAVIKRISHVGSHRPLQSNLIYCSFFS